MKKVFMGMFAIATMLLATSCSEDELIAQSSGNEVTVSFTASVRSDVKTKAVGDDTERIDQLIFAVYDENGVELQALRQSTHPTEDGCTNTTAISLSDADGGKKKATINVVLVKGQTYSFAFWAQHKNYDVYSFNPGTAEVSIDYKKQENTANNREADAFFANVNDLTVSGTFAKDITLRRPFAQVNFLTTIEDIKNARAAGFDPKTSSIVVENAATSLNVLTGEVEGNEKAVFNYASLLYKKDKLNEIETINSITDLTGVYKYLATAYFLPTEATAETQITTSMEVKAEESTKDVVALTAPDVKARRNYRTNIYGNLLTSNGTFSVTIDPIFDGNHNVEVEEKTVTYDKLSEALSANKDNTEALTYNVEAAEEQGNVSIEIPAGTSAASLTFSLEDLADNATISVSNATGGNYENPVVIEVPEDVNLGNITIDLPNAHVTLKQGSYTEVISTTSSTTLEVGAGTTIETLEVKQGNVRIAEGGKVGTITNSTEGTLYIIDAGGTLPTTLPTNTIVIYEDTKHAVALNDKYSADNIVDILSYNRDVLKEVAILRLTEDINLDAMITIAKDENIVLDLNGKTITGTDKTAKNFSILDNQGILTIKNTNISEGKFTLNATNNRGWDSYSAVVANNPGGNLTVESGVVIEHLGGTDMAYGIDNLTNGKGTSAITTINGATIKSTYRAIRQFLNGVEAANELYVNSGIIEGNNKSIWMHDPNAKANTGKLVVKSNVQLKGDVYLFVTAGSTEWPVEASIADAALIEGSKVIWANLPEHYWVINENSIWKNCYEENTYFIDTKEKLVAFANEVKLSPGETVKLVADIDLKDTVFNGLTAFNPEKNNTFDGQGHTVSNWTYEGNISDMGFIRNWVGPIKNIEFDNCHLKTAGRSAIVAAKVYGNIENITVNNCSIEDSYWACGIVAGLYNSGSISNCTVTNSSIKSNGGTGGIVGVINETAGERKLTNCSVSNSTINNTGIYGEACSGGGLIGMFNVDNATYKIEKCTVANNTLEGEYIYDKYPANENVTEVE